MAKTIVSGMLERKGRVKAEVVADHSDAVLRALVNKHITPRRFSYDRRMEWVQGINFKHAVVNHAIEYVRGKFTLKGLRTSGTYSSGPWAEPISA
jgi:hypothetical protein